MTKAVYKYKNLLFKVLILYYIVSCKYSHIFCAQKYLGYMRTGLLLKSSKVQTLETPKKEDNITTKDKNQDTMKLCFV